ncbi:Co2+/Mg2+ efflux protein ApaG [Pseudomonas neustonica]|uniref:Protein ApaG n=1 Tax=Pseudomonas neustonica TaxID=2487346 RepID=A0ABX9XMQ2_9PSED|nr:MULTISPECIES: Co2+/Mg2+ efflux protein ApaG [Pseudomonas]MAB23640.1 Co2+/Mg2+ efflux protein ApaG [Pseudomonadales bacterium]ROZ85730.1 Co2+/Mg2+ efflux protein ApaG [Pseudomonas sp. SSM44]ROZ87378.1 Co2+/Mg2+ efflux protein ApaG [Pseudomonas neustonica]|tara:strand:- start:160 stop:543 length:384 start_codon:yes stop_codon:yes gene_type:complete
MSNAETYAIDVSVQTRYLREQSDPDAQRFAFAYTITIANLGALPAQLLSRSWLITDGNSKVQEVQGPGVVGEQPTIAPGASHTYTSGCLLETPVGTMEGSYDMRASDGHQFVAEINRFRLAKPNALN